MASKVSLTPSKPHLSLEDASLMKLDDWNPPLVARSRPPNIWHADIGRWIFRFSIKHRPHNLTDTEFACYCQKILAEAVGSVEEAKKMIYVISRGPRNWGFCALVDKATAYKVHGLSPQVSNVAPDFFSELRDKNNTTELYPIKYNPGKYVVRVWGCGLNFSSHEQLLRYYVDILAEAIGSVEEAKKMIYVISRGPRNWGFCALVDKATAYKVHVSNVAPDFFSELRDKNNTTELYPIKYNPGKYVVRVWGCGLNFSSHEQLLRYYVHILAEAIGSKEEAKKKIYFVSPTWDDLSFGAEIDVKTKEKLQYLGNVAMINVDFYDEGRKKFPIVCSATAHFPLNWNHRLRSMFEYRNSLKELTNIDGSGDSGHWLIHIAQPDGEKEVMDHCEELFSQCIESGDAKDRIYVVWRVEPFGFGAAMDEKTALKLKDSKGVKSVFQDYGFKDIKNPFGILEISPSAKEDGIPLLSYSYPSSDSEYVDSESDIEDEEKGREILEAKEDGVPHVAYPCPPDSENDIEDEEKGCGSPPVC